MKREIVTSTIYAVLLLIALLTITRIALDSIPTSRETAVVDCVRETGNEYYTVTVEDSKGEQWAYYDNSYQPIGTILNCSFNGNEIVDAKEEIK